MRERLQADPADPIQRYMYQPRIFGDLEGDYEAMQLVNRVHLVMLAESGIVERDVVVRILRALDELDAEGPHALPLSTALEDLHLNLETILMRRLGAETGGRMHTGRSRNDLYATMHRLKARKILQRITGLLLALRGEMLCLAEAHAETVMTGYTHLQPAQPITFGHYLSAIADGLARDCGRVLECWPRLNLCPLGAGALATTGFPVDRYRTAELLGFDGLLENSLDCVAARDFAAEMMAAFCLTTLTLSRLHHDLHLWTTNEFGLLGIGDDIAGVSSMMPQKKNPAAIEQCRAKAGLTLSGLVAFVAATAQSPYTNTRQNSEGLHHFRDSALETEASLALTRVVIGGLQPDKARMAAAAGANFSTFTELADTMVRDAGLPFRAAHAMTGALTRLCLQRGITGAKDVTAELVAQAMAEVAPGTAPLPEAMVRAALDPQENVGRRRVPGGPAPTETLRMVARARVQLDTDRGLYEAREAGLAAAAEKRHTALAVLLA
jgi:argininosuccinate lyase